MQVGQVRAARVYGVGSHSRSGLGADSLHTEAELVPALAQSERSLMATYQLQTGCNVTVKFYLP